MNRLRHEFLNLENPPGRLTAAEAGWRLGLHRDELRVVCSLENIQQVRASLPLQERHLVLSGKTRLRPLGSPSPGCEKFYLEPEIARLESDVAWLDRALRTIRIHLRLKKRRTANKKTANEKLTPNCAPLPTPGPDIGSGI